MSRNPPRDATAFEWPPSAGDLSSVTVVQVGAPTAVSATRAASRAVATAPALASSAPRRPRRRLNTLQQLTLLAAGMLVGAALPGIDDGRRPIVGIGQAAEAASAPAAAEAAAGAASATVSPAAVPALPVDATGAAGVAEIRDGLLPDGCGRHLGRLAVGQSRRVDEDVHGRARTAPVAAWLHGLGHRTDGRRHLSGNVALPSARWRSLHPAAARYVAVRARASGRHLADQSRDRQLNVEKLANCSMFDKETALQARRARISQ